MSEQHVSATGGFAYGVVGADIHVFGDGTPLYVLRRWAPAPETDPRWLRQQPSRMLHARFAVAPFTGREDDLGALHAWCAGDPQRAARWLHAPGGQGKTRLAQQLAAELSGQGWKVVTAVEGPGTVLPPPGSQDLTPDGTAGLLLLVDYADRWPLTTLTWLFSNALLHRPDVRARVLLLARGTNPWPALRGALAGEQIDVSTQALGPLGEPSGPAAGQGERGAMFRAARAAFAERYGIVAPVGEPGLTDDDFGLVLAVHMAALVAVDAAASGRRAPPDLAGLLGPGDVVALRRSEGYATRAELVRHTSLRTRVLAQGRTLTGARLAATAYGCVVSLPLTPQVLVVERTGELRQVDLGQWALSTGGPMAVTPGGDRMVLCDGYRLIAVHAALGHALAAAPVSAEHAPVRELVFVGEDALVTAGRHGGLVLWRLDAGGMLPVASRDTPMLSQLCAVPAWDVVSGHSGSEGRVRFFDPWRGLAPVDAPPSIVGSARRLRAVLAAPGGRHVLYSGQLDVDAPQRSRSFAFVTRAHDLHHPGSLLRRSPAGLGDAERAALARAGGDDPGVRDLLRLANVMATRH